MAALVPQQQLGEGAVLLALLSKIPPLPSVQPLAEAHSALTLLSCVFFWFLDMHFFKPAHGESRRPFRCQHRFHLKALIFFFSPWIQCWFWTVQNGSHFVCSWIQKIWKLKSEAVTWSPCSERKRSKPFTMLNLFPVLALKMSLWRWAAFPWGSLQSCPQTSRLIFRHMQHVNFTPGL